MKKILLFFIMCLSINVSAQSIFGIDINTNYKNFSLQLNKKNFKVIKSQKNIYSCIVTYAGYRNVKLNFTKGHKTDMITDVTLKFPRYKRISVYEIFNDLNKQFEVKYQYNDCMKYGDTMYYEYNDNGGKIKILLVSSDLYVIYEPLYKEKENVKPSSDI